MKALSVYFLVKLADPGAWLIIALLMLPFRRPWAIPIVGVFVAVLTETLLTLTQETREWGRMLGIGVLCNLIQAWIVFSIFSVFRSRKKTKNVGVSEAISSARDGVSKDQPNQSLIADSSAEEEIGCAPPRDRGEIPFYQYERGMLSDMIKDAKDLGLDIRFTEAFDKASDRALADGVMELHSPNALKMDFLIAKVEGERGFFGKPKEVFKTYYKHTESADFIEGGVFVEMQQAFQSLLNLYRLVPDHQK